MEKYLIVTDTTSAMNKEIAAAHGIELISLSVIVDGQEYKDQVDISTEQLYDYLKDKTFVENLGEYYQGSDSTKIKKRVITYQMK